MKIFTQQHVSVLEKLIKSGRYETRNEGVKPIRLRSYRKFLNYYKTKYDLPRAKGLIFGLYCFEGKPLENISDYTKCIKNSLFCGGIQGYKFLEPRVLLELEVPDDIVHKTDFGYFVDFLSFFEEEDECHLEYTDVFDKDRTYGTYLGQATFYKIERSWIKNVYYTKEGEWINEK